MDISQNKQHQIIGNLKINWNHKTIFQTHNFMCFPSPLLFVPCLCNDEGLSHGCTSINSSINRTLNKTLKRLRACACEQWKFSFAIISVWFIDAKLESDAAFLRRDAAEDAASITCGKWRLEIAEMDLNHGLPRPTQAQTGSNKNNSSNQILIGSIRPGGQLSCYYFPGKWPNNLNRCLHPLHPTSRSWYTATQQRGSIKQIHPSHLDTKRELWNINSAISIAVLYFCTLMGWNNCPWSRKPPPEQLLAKFDVGHWVQSVTLDWEFIIQ